MNDITGAKDEIRSLYDLYASDIYRFARLTLGDPERARDVVQETFLRAFRSWDKYRKDSSSKTWLMSIARNYVFDLLRKNRTERQFLSNHIHTDRIPDQSESVETMILLEGALSQIKDTYRQVFVLRHVHELSVQETARILNWSTSKVKTTDSRAIAKLNEILSEGLGEVNG